MKVIVLLVLLILTSCSKSEEGVSTYQTTPSINTMIELELLDGINIHRISLNLNPLKTDKLAKKLADDHAKWMRDNDTISHHNVTLRISILLNSGAKSVSENLAYGYSTSEAVMVAWIDSDSHNKILTNNSSHIGVSVIDKYYVVILVRY